MTHETNLLKKVAFRSKKCIDFKIDNRKIKSAVKKRPIKIIQFQIQPSEIVSPTIDHVREKALYKSENRKKVRFETDEEMSVE